MQHVRGQENFTSHVFVALIQWKFGFYALLRKLEETYFLPFTVYTKQTIL